MTDPLTTQVRQILTAMLTTGAPDGAVDLLAQVPATVVVGGPITSLLLQVDATAAQAGAPNGYFCSMLGLGPDHQAEGLLNLWIKDGYLSTLDYSWFTDEMPTSLPPLDRIEPSGF